MAEKPFSFLFGLPPDLYAMLSDEAIEGLIKFKLKNEAQRMRMPPENLDVNLLQEMIKEFVKEVGTNGASSDRAVALLESIRSIFNPYQSSSNKDQE